MDFASTLVHELLNKDKKVDRIAVERDKWASDPQYTQKLYAHIQRQWVSDDKAKKLGVGASLEKVESHLSDEDPRKGLGALAHEEFMRVLPHAPKNLHPYQVAAAVYNKMLAEKVPDLFNYARKQDTSMFGTGLLGDKYKLGPLTEHYKAWREEENKAAPGVIAGAFGKEGLGGYFDSETAPERIGLAAGTGGLVTAISEAARRRAATAGAGTVAKMIARGAAASPHPMLKIAGMAALAIPEFMAWDTATGAAKGTEWYRARDVKMGEVGITEALTSSDWWKTTGLDAALGIAAIKLGTKGVAKGIEAGLRREGLVPGGALDVLSDITRAEKVSQLGLDDLDRSLQQTVVKGLAFPNPENLMRAMENKAARDLGARDLLALRRTGDDARIQVLAEYAGRGAGEGVDVGRAAMTLEDKAAEGLLDVLSTGKATGLKADQSVALMAEQLRRGVIAEGGEGLSSATEKKLLKNKTIKTLSEQLRGVKDLDALNEKVNKGLKLEDAIREQKLAEETLGEYFPETALGIEKAGLPQGLKPWEKQKLRDLGYMDVEIENLQPSLGRRLVATKTGPELQRAKDDLALRIDRSLERSDEVLAGKKPAGWVNPAKVIDKAIPAVESTRPVSGMTADEQAKALFEHAKAGPVGEAKVYDLFEKGRLPEDVYTKYVDLVREHKGISEKEAMQDARSKKLGDELESEAEDIGKLVGDTEVVTPGRTVKGKPYDQEKMNLFKEKLKPFVDAGIVNIKSMKGIFAAALTGGLAMTSLDAIDPGAAQAAGVADRQVGKLVTDAFKGVYDNTTKMFEAMRDMKLLAPKINPENPYVVQDLQRGITIVPDPDPSKMVARRKRLPLNLDYWMSPFTKAQIYYGKTDAGREILQNPMVSSASHYTAAINNTEHMNEVFMNITKEVPGLKSDFKVIADEMKELNSQYATRHAIEGYDRYKVSNLSDIMTKMEKRIKGKNITEEERAQLTDTLTQAQIEHKVHTDRLKETEGFWGEYNTKWQQKMMELSEKSASTRIALAVEDTSEFTKYPWLRDKMSRDELIAVGRLKAFNEQAAAMMKEQGLPIVEATPYIHHAVHPETNYNELKKILDKLATEGGDEAFRLSKFHSRTANSLQMMPDVHYIYSKYIPDFNRRLQWNDFWKPGKKDGWAAHANHPYVQNSEGLKKFWDGFKRGFDPVEVSGTDKWAKRMYDFEIARLLAMSPSVAFKHAMKLEANWSNFGIAESASILPKSLDLLRRMRFTKNVPQDMETTAARSFTNQGKMYQTILDYDTYTVPNNVWDSMIEKWNNTGSMLIDTVERFDRGHSFLAAIEMAHKQGMTPAQAAYGVYDTILKTNFLSGPMNPTWLRDPKIRMMAMFQGTPFKILEQRAIQAIRAGRGVKEGWNEIHQTLQNIKADVKEGEHLFKANLVMDALKREQDIFGTPVTQQMMRKMLIIGSVVMGARMGFDADLWSHFSHPPFLKFQQSEFGLAAMPVAQAAHQAYGKERGEDEYYFTDFFNAWLKDGLLQSQFIKANRLSKDDIPERYKDSAFKYIFGIPAVAEKNK